MTREEKEQVGKYVLQMARFLADGCYQQEMLLKAVHFIDETLEQEQEPKIGHWIEEKVDCGRKIFCSECGGSPPFEYVSTGDIYSATGYGVVNKTKFCPSCGAKMEKE